MKKLILYIPVIFLFEMCLVNSYAQVSVTRLRCELLSNPAGIDVPKPAFSWQLNSGVNGVVQQFYTLLVSSSVGNLEKNVGDVWNSGKVLSGECLNILYGGKPLKSSSKYYWKVLVQTNKGEASATLPASFTTGLLNSADWKASWIGWDKPFPWDSVSQFSRLSARYFRKTFVQTRPPVRAVVHISGLGLYELFINGRRIGDQVLAPAPTDYRKTVLYNSFDVTEQIISGQNTIGVTLGNGRFFTMRQDYKPKKINNFGFPKLLLQLELFYADGSHSTIVSDGSWRFTADGPIRTNNEYDGEEYDARKEMKGWSEASFSDAKWLKAALVERPAGKVTAQPNPPMKVMKVMAPKAISKLGDSAWVLDMGQNMTGWIAFKVRGRAGQKITLKYAESLQPDGTLNIANLRDARTTDVYTLKGGDEETWEPRFVFHGFRYVMVKGFQGDPSVTDFAGKVVYDEMANTGTFSSSNEILNGLHKNAWWGIAGNYKGMPVDCPQRNERQPWLGDRTQGALGESFLFENQALYTKWLQDIGDAQTQEGAIPDVAPAFWNYYSDVVTWPAAYFTVADMLYEQFGDPGPIKKHYGSMKKWLTYMKSKYMKDGIIIKDKYGDWCVPPESPELIHAKDSLRLTDGKLLATAYYYRILVYMKKFAVLSGNAADTTSLNQLAEKVSVAFNGKFYQKDKKQYDNNTVTANLLPLYFGLAPGADKDAVFNKIVSKVLNDNFGHISTGVIGTQWLMRGLSNNERPDIAYTLATNTSYPSWGYMLKNGATTIWELWNGNTANPQMNSQNHVMLLGDLLTWMYENLAGIKSVEPGFKKIMMKPQPVDRLSFINASFESAYGTIVSSWQSNVDHFTWTIKIPANTSARIWVPASSVSGVEASGKKMEMVEGVKVIGMDGAYAVFEVGSGDYDLLSNYAWKAGMLKDEFIYDRAEFPQAHSSTIAETPDGLIAAWFGGTREGNKDVCIYTSRLVKNSWTKPEKVADGVLNDSTRYACYNPVLYYAPNGELLLFYKIGPNVAGWTGWLKRSKDNGKTWSQREALPEGFLGPIKNKPELINGVLVCPSSTEKNDWKAHFEYTPDFGKTWTKSDPLNDGTTIQAIQPSILRYADGRLQVLCRSRNTTINESWSSDGGKTWSAMQASALPNNNSGTDAVTLQDGRQLLVYNHVLPDSSWVKGKGPRTPLNVSVSKDGKTWFASLILEDSPISQYSYPSVIQTRDGMVHIVYTWRRERIKHVVVDPAKLELKEIVNKEWPGGTRYAGKTSDD